MDSDMIGNGATTEVVRARKGRQMKPPDLQRPCCKNCVRNTLLTLKELAIHTGLPLKWLRRQAAKGKIPALKAGNQLRFSVEAVEDWAKEKATKNQFGEYTE